MASAAAVGVNVARSPTRNNIGEDEGKPGEITSGIYSKDEGLPGVNGGMEDSDEDLPSNPLKGHRARHPVDRDAEEDEAGGELDLFGDDDERAAGKPEQSARRQLDDEELDSDDDVDRTDRIGDEQEQEPEYETQEKVTMDLEIPRQAMPEPSDGEMYLLKMPNFMSIDPHAWDHKTFQPPTTDHHSTKAPSSRFSAYSTALTTVRWRHSPSDHHQLQSNARINRWADGSLTLQLASDPTTQYEIDGNALAPPQRNPIKPTPTSIQTTTNKAGRPRTETNEAYTYLVRPHPDLGSMIVTHKITAGLSVRKPAAAEEDDDALEQLQANLAAASNAAKVNGATGFGLVQTEEDPELARQQALKAVQDAEKARKKNQSAIDREAARTNRVMGRSGLGSNRYSGLNVGMLEDDEEGGGRKGPSPQKGRKQRRRRNSEYSEDEDFGRKRFTKEDEYDEEDDFLAPSDEEEVVDDDDDDPDDGIVEVPRHHHRERTPKRDRPAAAPEDDDEADAPGEEDDEEEMQMARTKRRRVVDEDDDEE